MTKSANEVMYGTLRPKRGISLMGEKISGPTPSTKHLSVGMHRENEIAGRHIPPMPYIDKPSEALGIPTPNLSITPLLASVAEM